MTGPYRRWCISGRRLLFGKCHILPLSSLVFAIRKTRKVDSRKKSLPLRCYHCTHDVCFGNSSPGFLSVCCSANAVSWTVQDFTLPGLGQCPRSVLGVRNSSWKKCAFWKIRHCRLSPQCPWAGQVRAHRGGCRAVPQGGKSATALQGDTAELTGSFGLMHVLYKSFSACLFTIVCLSLMFLRQ